MRVLAYAKVNLTLEVLNRRADGFHALRTVFQTVSLSDVLDIEAERSRATQISLTSDIEIPGENLITKAAHALLAAAGVGATVSFRLKKRIPMGAGLGGGSADAAAVLRTLPGLLGVRMDGERVTEIAASLGSDVPYFLLGGTVLGLGRGTELYPLAELVGTPLLIVAPGIHVATAEAYRLLRRTECFSAPFNLTERFARSICTGEWYRHCVNDFEGPVFAIHPVLASLQEKLSRTGALVARMTGSGSALFGVYESVARRNAASLEFPAQQIFKASFVSRRRLPYASIGVVTPEGA